MFDSSGVRARPGACPTVSPVRSSRSPSTAPLVKHERTVNHPLPTRLGLPTCHPRYLPKQLATSSFPPERPRTVTVSCCGRGSNAATGTVGRPAPAAPSPTSPPDSPPLTPLPGSGPGAAGWAPVPAAPPSVHCAESGLETERGLRRSPAPDPFVSTTSWGRHGRVSGLESAASCRAPSE